jgi:cell division protein FtsZ
MNLPGIVIIGCGDVGNDIISGIHRSGITGAETIAINTDKEHLDKIRADKRILIGKALKGGLGAGGCPIMGRRAAEYGIPTINAVIESADLVFITAGLGGGTGTGSIPLIAEWAGWNKSLIICFVTLPSESERYKWITAMRGLKEILKNADSVIVLDYRKTASLFPHLSSAQVYQKMDQMIADTIREITELLTVPALINFDFTDLRVFFKKKGIGLLLAGMSEEGIHNKNESVFRSTLAHPTTDMNFNGASVCLVCITGDSDIDRFYAEDISTAIASSLDRHADVVWGLNEKKEMEGRIRVFAVLTGLHEGADVLFSESHRDTGANIQLF